MGGGGVEDGRGKVVMPHIQIIFLNFHPVLKLKTIVFFSKILKFQLYWVIFFDSFSYYFV